jgi:hypothetical protein
MKRFFLAAWLFLLVGLPVGELSGQAPPPSGQTAGSAGAATAAVNEFLNTFRRGDYRRAHDLSSDTAGAIQSIRDHNPKILWDQLIEQNVYAHVLSCVPRMKRYMVDPDPMIGGNQCMPLILVYTFYWFPSTATWEVIETRQQRDGDDRYFQAWVVVRYASSADADQPFDGRKTRYWGDPKARFRETLLSFILMNGSMSLRQEHQRDVLYDPLVPGGSQPTERTAAPPPGAAVRPPTPPEALIDEVTREDQDSRTFPIRSVVVSKGLDAAWLRTKEFLARSKDKVIESNKEKCLIVTELTSHGFSKRYDKYCIVLETVTENTTRVVLKLLSYDKNYEKTGVAGPLVLAPAASGVIEKLRTTFFDQLNK